MFWEGTGLISVSTLGITYSISREVGMTMLSPVQMYLGMFQFYLNCIFNTEIHITINYKFKYKGDRQDSLSPFKRT